MKIYRKYARLPTCWLSKAELTRLVQLAMEQAAQVTMSTRIADTTIEASTLKAFLAHADLPPVLDNLHIQGGTEHCSITIELSRLLSAIEISAEDAVWMYVRYEQLHDFLQQHRQVEPPGRIESTLAVGITTGAALILIAQLIMQQKVLYGCMAGITGAIVLLRYCWWAFLRRDRCAWAPVYYYADLHIAANRHIIFARLLTHFRIISAMAA